MGAVAVRGRDGAGRAPQRLRACSRARSRGCATRPASSRACCSAGRTGRQLRARAAAGDRARSSAPRPELVVNVGSAEGYYAVGLAIRLPWARGGRLRARPGAARRRRPRSPRLNGVDARLELRGLCTPAELAALGPRAAAADTFVLMDCEGAEAELADPDAVPWLAGARLLIELHPATRRRHPGAARARLRAHPRARADRLARCAGRARSTASCARSAACGGSTASCSSPSSATGPRTGCWRRRAG